MSTRIDDLLREINDLAPAERALVQQALAPVSAMRPDDDQQRDADESFKRRLVEAGLMKEVKGPVTDLGPYRHREPFEVEGAPLSEMIIEDRH